MNAQLYNTISLLLFFDRAFFPFAMGLLTGKYNNKVDGPNNTKLMSSNKRSRLEEYDLFRYATGDGAVSRKGEYKIF